MLRKCRLNPSILAFTFLHGVQDYNTVLLSSTGWRILIHEGPEEHALWDFNEVEGFFISPAFENYRCYKSLVPATGGVSIRTSDIVVFFPLARYSIPSLSSPEETVLQASQNLGQGMRIMATHNPVYAQLSTYVGSQQLTHLIHKATNDAKCKTQL